MANVEKNDNEVDENVTNPYDQLSNFHPSVRGTDKHYWILPPALPKDQLLRRLEHNLELARELDDDDYFDFLERYLGKEGYEGVDDLENLEKKELEEIIQGRAKIKLQLTLKAPKTHSKTKTRQHEQALTMQKNLSGKSTKVTISDPEILRTIKDLSHPMILDDNNEIGVPIFEVSDLKMGIIKYVAKKDLQQKTNFGIDRTLAILLGSTPNICSYFELKERLVQYLSNDITNISVTTSPNSSQKHYSTRPIAEDIQSLPILGAEDSTLPNRVPIQIKPINLKPKLKVLPRV